MLLVRILTVETTAMHGRIFAILLLAGLLPPLTAHSQSLNTARLLVDDPLTTTAPATQVFGALFPGDMDSSLLHATTVPHAALNVFDPLLAGVLLYDRHLPRGQRMAMDEELVRRLMLTAPPATAPVTTYNPADEPVVMVPSAVLAPVAPNEPTTLIPPLLIGAGVSILALLGIIELRNRARARG